MDTIRSCGYAEHEEGMPLLTTVTAVPPVTPSMVALIVAIPGVTAVTTPDELTVAAAVFVDDHVTERPMIG
jgi:hypothetical protein